MHKLTVLKSTVLVLFFVAISTSAYSQEVTMAMANTEPIEPGPAAVVASAPPASLPEVPSEHRFWDNENRALFVTTAAFCAADFTVTRENLQNGGKELNPITRVFSGSTAGLALNFAGETAGVVGLSYFFHKTGHHRLERLAPVVNFSASAVAVAYGLSHR